MDQPSTAAPGFVGTDVSKDRPDAHLRPSDRTFAVPRDDRGIEQRLARLRADPPALIVLEATGGFEVTVAAADLPLAVVNPRQIRDVARATGRLAKAGRLDTEAIALFAERVRPEPRSMPDADARASSELVARHRQARAPKVARTIAATLKVLEAQLADPDRDISGVVRGCPARRAADNLLQSVPGIGAVASRTLIAEMPELGLLDRREAATLLGVAPFDRNSGRMRGHRAFAGGRTTVRNVLAMATLPAIRWNPVLKNHDQPLTARSRPKMVAIVAGMRRLLGILKVSIRTQSPWRAA